MAGKPKSAYFIEDESNTEAPRTQITKIITNFPISRNCLWYDDFSVPDDQLILGQEIIAVSELRSIPPRSFLSCIFTPI
jgi:hypothetical protein